MTGVAWLWIYAALALVILELVTPGFILCFFGMAAFTVGIIRAIVGESFSLSWQLAAFSVLSVFYIVLLRRYLKKIFVGEKGGAKYGLSSEYVGRWGVVTEAINPPRTGRVLIGDAEWTASADVQIPSGADVQVVFQRNLTMKVSVNQKETKK